MKKSYHSMTLPMRLAVTTCRSEVRSPIRSPPKASTLFSYPPASPGTFAEAVRDDLGRLPPLLLTDAREPYHVIDHLCLRERAQHLLEFLYLPHRQDLPGVGAKLGLELLVGEGVLRPAAVVGDARLPLLAAL